MEVISISLSDALLEQLDTFMDEHGYGGRSEVVREAARALFTEFEDRHFDDRPLLGIVAVRFEYDSPKIEDWIRRLRHEHHALIVSNAHNCIGDRSGCLELFLLEALLKDISGFVRKARAIDETLAVEYSLLPIDSADTAAM